MSRTLLCAALAALCAAASGAAPAQEREAKDPCADAQTQAEMNVCSAKKFRAADAELNRVYNQLVSKLEGDAGHVARLKAAEVSWLKYRDDNCDYEASIYEGGSIKPLIHASCLERMTKARTAELREQIKEQDN